MLLSKLLLGDSARLTALTHADLPTLAGWHQDAGFLRLYDARPAYPQTEAALAQWLDDRHKASDAFLFAVRPADDDALIGCVELDSIMWPHGTAWASIAIGEERWRGRGYGRAAMALALQFAFCEINLHRVQLTVFSYNRPAVGLYEKLGFRREGVYREALQRDGARHDMYLYGLLRREWESGQGRAPGGEAGPASSRVQID